MSMGDMTSQFALDMNGFQRLQHNARVDPEAGVQGAARGAHWTRHHCGTVARYLSSAEEPYLDKLAADRNDAKQSARNAAAGDGALVGLHNDAS